MARETKTLGNQSFQDGNLSEAIDEAQVPSDFTAVPLSSSAEEWENYVDLFGTVSLINAIEQASESGGTYTNTTQMPVAVGGYPIGTTFDAVTMSEMFDGLLYPYQNPAFSAFVMSGQTTPVEVGATLLTNPNFTWTATNTDNIAPGSVEIVDVTGSMTVLATGLDFDDSPQSVTLAGIQKTAIATHTFRITGENTEAGSFTRDATYSWQWRVYYGTSASTSLDAAAILALTNKPLSSGFSGTYALASGDYKYICYAAVLGTATSFTDAATGFAVAMNDPTTVNVTNILGQSTDYKVHRTTNTIASTINIVVS